ncbi:MAG: NifU family protein [bacterium]
MKMIENALDEIRPALRQDGGDVEAVSFDPASGRLEVRFLGHCAGCPFARQTLKQGIERAVRERLPEVSAVEMVD